MQLSLHADYALRVLIYAGSHPRRTVTTSQISEAYGISRTHLVRVVHTLGVCRYIDVIPGRNGGIRLRRPAEEILLGQVVRDAEPNMRLVECFDPATNTCPITKVCGLKNMLRLALEAFLGELDQHTLADLTGSGRNEVLAQALLQIAPLPGPPRGH